MITVWLLAFRSLSRLVDNRFDKKDPSAMEGFFYCVSIFYRTTIFFPISRRYPIHYKISNINLIIIGYNQSDIFGKRFTKGVGMDKQTYLDLYYQMVLIRRLEERGAELYQAGKIGGFMHLYIGQEAVSTGLIAARQPQDRVITAYRDHGVAINCGIPANQVMAELLGKASGISKGRGGSMHMADVTKNFWGGHAIVGAHMPLASGLALGDKRQEFFQLRIGAPHNQPAVGKSRSPGAAPWRPLLSPERRYHRSEA